eukprot:scaffold51320_cov69-Phaeocystis_antarctica.AAC.4
MDLDAFLVAAHWHTHEQKIERRERATFVIARGRFEWSRRSLRANVKSSMTHHSLEQYVGPATTSSVWQPARKTGKQASDCWMLPWSMHALSCGTRRGARMYRACMRCGKGAARMGERDQPECRLDAGYLLAPLRPARHDRVLGAGRLLLIIPRVAQKGGHFPHRRRHRLGRQFSGAGARPKPCACQVRGVQPTGGQATEKLRGAFERGVGIAAADERRDRRRLFRLGAAPTQAPQAAVDAATIAGRGEGGAQEAAQEETSDTQDRTCPVAVVASSLDVACDAGPSVDHAQTQPEEAVHGPQPPQGGAGLHGAITAAAQRGSERGGGGEV